mmetsp:Transcript_63365/g.182379  ORF Transcript_63365/g.182379 Transcript_63365/m.182379 type:complete len:258 (+) Transcript_63365:1631-2404(+)
MLKMRRSSTVSSADWRRRSKSWKHLRSLEGRARSAKNKSSNILSAASRPAECASCIASRSFPSPAPAASCSISPLKSTNTRRQWDKASSKLEADTQLLRVKSRASSTRRSNSHHHRTSSTAVPRSRTCSAQRPKRPPSTLRAFGQRTSRCASKYCRNSSSTTSAALRAARLASPPPADDKAGVHARSVGRPSSAANVADKRPSGINASTRRTRSKSGPDNAAASPRPKRLPKRSSIATDRGGREAPLANAGLRCGPA